MPVQEALQFAQSVSTLPDGPAAARQAATQLAQDLGRRPDLVALFVSSHHLNQADALGALVQGATQAGCLLGCTAETVVAGDREYESTPTVAVWGACLPGANVVPLRLELEQTREGHTFVGWPEDLPAVWPEGAALLILGEPYTFPADTLLERLNEDRPGVPILGGMASGGHGPDEHRLWLGGQSFKTGAVGCLISGAVKIESVVSQGCRPIGKTYVVTKCERNVIFEMGGEPALARLHETLEGLGEDDRELVRRGLHMGLVTNEYKEEFRRGDFLVRNCMGADRETGALGIGDYVRRGQTVQFHVRDGRTADEDLRELLKGVQDRPTPRGALLFTCNGRGTRLFDQPHHDAGVLRAMLGNLAVAGLFAQGEIGPIGGKNFLHGFTASVALFSPRN